MARVYTAQLTLGKKIPSLGSAIFIDITQKSGRLFTGDLAPSWDMIRDFKAGAASNSPSDISHERDYTSKYLSILSTMATACKDFFSTILASGTDIVLACYCGKGCFCHRHLLKHKLMDVGFEDGGEISDVLESECNVLTGHTVLVRGNELPLNVWNERFPNVNIITDNQEGTAGSADEYSNLPKPIRDAIGHLSSMWVKKPQNGPTIDISGIASPMFDSATSGERLIPEHKIMTPLMLEREYWRGMTVTVDYDHEKLFDLVASYIYRPKLEFVIHEQREFDEHMEMLYREAVAS